MGVSLETWRAAIGLFAQRQFKGSSRSGKHAAMWKSSLVPVLAIIMVLLVIGNIEMNPGPPCKFSGCEVVTETIASSIRHQHFHSSNSNFMFYCPSPDCVYFTKSFNALNFHVSTFHRATRHQSLDVSEGVDKITCTVLECPYTTNSFWNLIQHLCQHLDVKSPSYTPSGAKCPAEDCRHSRPFQKSSTFRSHLSQYHPGWNSEGCPPTKRRKVDEEGTSSESSCKTQRIDLGVDLGDCDFDFDENIFEDGDVEETDDWALLDDDLIMDKIAKFYLQLYGEFLLPYETIQVICNGMQFISGLNNLRMKTVLKAGLQSLGMEQLNINELSNKVSMADVLFTSHHKNAPGPSLTSDYLRRQYFRKNYDFHEPDQIDLDKHSDSDKQLQYVSIRDTLSTVLKDPTVQKDIDESFLKQPSNTDEVSDYTDGSLFQEGIHDQKEIHLLLYQDAYNAVMNALGSAKDKYKSLAFYFTIGNLKPKHRSKIDSKHLVLLVRESIFKAVGPKVCLKELLKELKLIENVGVTYKGESIKVKVQFLLGDNLGQHTIGGFIEHFSGKFFCRFCDIERPVFLENPDHINPARSREDYANCVREANLTKESCKGIKRDCVFNDLQNIHAVSHLAPCLAHDLFEGVVSWDLAGIIQCFVRKGWFSYKLLNRRINAFRCKGTDKPNKPAFVRSRGKHKGKKLGGHAIQNWTLLRILPFIIGDKIKDFNDPAYKLYLQLKELCEFFCGHSFRKSDVPYIKDVLIPLYFERRSEVLDESVHNLKPKFHFMVHLVDHMLAFGPLIHVWTMGFEQKHKLSKNVCRQSRNFINVEYSCAVRHQLNLAYRATGPLFPEGSVEEEAKVFCIDSYHGELRTFLESNITQDSCRTCKTIDIDGTLYSEGSMLLLTPNGQDINCGKIRVILNAGGDTQFVIESIKATFNNSVGIHEIPQEATGELKLITAKNLKYPQPQPLYDFKGKLCFSIKEKVI